MSILVAWGLDATLAEPPLRLHPVAWAGRYLAAAGDVVPASPPARALLAGGAAWVAGAAVTLGAALAAESVIGRLPPALRPLARGTALWPMLSVRLLLTEVAAVETALVQGVEPGRAALARIVSRDASNLSPDEVREAALESLSENLSDSVVAPLFWYVVAGLPGAAVYRFSNTADACWGYRTPRWEHAGKVAARADDVLNLLPARLTAALLLPDPRRWRDLRHQAARTPSPNSGWPMAALALAGDLRLRKRGSWVLHDTGATPGPTHLRDALRRVRRTALAAAVAGALAARAVHLLHLRHDPPPEGER